MHILFIHASTDRHVGYSHLLVITHNAIMNISLQFLCVHMCSFLLAVYLGVKLLHYMVTLCLTFRINVKLFSKQLHPSASHQQRLRAPISPVVSFHNRHVSEHLIVVLVSISLMTNRDKCLFICLLAICIFL